MSASYPSGQAIVSVDFALGRVRVSRTKYGAVESAMKATVTQAEEELSAPDREQLAALAASIEHVETVDGRIPSDWFHQLSETLTVYTPGAPNRTSYGPAWGSPHASIAEWCKRALPRLLGAPS